eukprot:2119642-Pyramimonas_sp.AAC.1
MCVCSLCLSSGIRPIPPTWHGCGPEASWVPLKKGSGCFWEGLAVGGRVGDFWEPRCGILWLRGGSSGHSWGVLR